MLHAAQTRTRNPLCRVSRAGLAGLTGLVLAAAAPAWAQTPAPAAPAASAPVGQTLRLPVATPIQAAQQLLSEGKGQEAMAKVEEAAAVPDRTPYETYVLERTRAAAAQRLGQNARVLVALEAALATGLTPTSDELSLTEVMVSLASRERDHPRVLRWSQRYTELGGPKDEVRLIRIQSQAASGDHAGAQTALLARLAAADRAGQTLPEVQLRLLLGVQQLGKDAGTAATFERLAAAYPRPEYWADVVSLASREPGLSERALLQLYRLLRTTGNLKMADLREEMAQSALRLGQPGEAQVLVDEGFAGGGFGTPAHQKLRDQVRKQAAADKADRPAATAAAQRAKDGNALVDLGWALVASLPAGATAADVEPGLAMIEQGLAKGGLRRAAEARLHLAMAQLLAGRKDAARQSLSGLGAAAAAEGLATPVRLWTLFAAAPAMLPPRQ